MMMLPGLNAQGCSNLQETHSPVYHALFGHVVLIDGKEDSYGGHYFRRAIFTTLKHWAGKPRTPKRNADGTKIFDFFLTFPFVDWTVWKAFQGAISRYVSET